MAQTAQIILNVQNQQAIQQVQVLIGQVTGLAASLQGLKAVFDLNLNTVNQFFQSATAQAQQLEQQTLSLSGTFASLNQIFVSGVSLNDPLEKINALQPAIEESIGKVRQIALTISGVTSSQLVDVFKTIASDSSQANLTLDQSVQLVRSLTAGLVSANIPLFQQRTEINAILTGQITQDTVLAKQLGITNEIVAREKARGTLVDFLNERLKTSVAIQEKFSQTIQGATSNILDIAELTQAAFGQELLKPITAVINAFYKLLDDNKQQIFGYASFLGSQFVAVGEIAKKIFDAIAPILIAVGDLLKGLAPSTIQAFVGALGALGNVVAGLASVLGTVLVPILNLFNSDLGKVVITAGIFTAVINAGAVGAVIKFGEALIGVIVSTAGFVASSAVRISTIIAETVAVGGLDVSLKGVIATQELLTGVTAGPIAASAIGIATITAGLIALGVALAASTVALVYFTDQLEKQNQAAADSDAATKATFDASLRTAQSLKNLANERAKNGKLTKEQEEQEKRLTDVARLQTKANTDQIESLKKEANLYPDRRAALESEIKNLEGINEQLTKLKTGGLPVAQIGSAYGFLAQQASTALKVISAGVNQEDFDKRVKEISDITKQQVELGLITRQEAIAQLEVVAKTEGAKVESRAAANKQILALIKDVNKEEVDLNKNKEAELQQLAAEGYISEYDSLQQISDLKKRSLEIDAENTRAANKKIAEDTARDKKSALDKLETDLAETKAAPQSDDPQKNAGTLQRVQALQEQIAKTKADFANQELNNEKKLLGDEDKIRADAAKAEQDRINQQVKYLRGVLERETDENANLRKKAEYATQADIQKLKLGGYQNDLVLQEQDLAQKKRSTDSELLDKRRLLEFDKTNLANFVGSQSEKEALIIKISKQEADIAKLNLDQTDNLIARTKILYEAKIKGLEQEKESLDKVAKLLESQNSLETARIGLVNAVTNAELKAGETRLQNLKEVGNLLKQNNSLAADRAKQNADAQIKADREVALAGLSEDEKAAKQKEFQAEDQAKTEKDAKEKQAKDDALNDQKAILAKRRLADLGFSAGTSELEIARQTFAQEQKNLELKARQFEATQANEQRTLQIQQQQADIKDRQLASEAKLALLRAEESGEEDQIKQALELVNLTQEQVKNDKELAKVQTDTLNVKQKADREAFNAEQKSATYKNQLEGVESGLQANQVLGTNTSTIQANAPALQTIANEKKATQTIKADEEKNTKKVLANRTKTIGEVANGAVAFENTSEKIDKNFASLPNSLKKTAEGLKEVIGYSKELNDSPIFKSREEAKAKEAKGKADFLQQQESVKQQAQAPVQQAASERDTIAAKNELITKNNEKITNRNELGKVANKLFSNVTGSLGLGDNTIQNAQATASNAIEEYELKKRKEESAKAQDIGFSLGYFTGGIPPIDLPVTVNEQGQEAVTNLKTGQTSLLPSGQRQVIFGDTSYIHNAIETRNMLATSNKEVTQSRQSVDTGVNNSAVVDALNRLHGLIATREPVIKATTNFYNEPQPSHQVYETLRATRRAMAV
jgi:hypothetical protein